MGKWMKLNKHNKQIEENSQVYQENKISDIR